MKNHPCLSYKSINVKNPNHIQQIPQTHLPYQPRSNYQPVSSLVDHLGPEDHLTTLNSHILHHSNLRPSSLILYYWKCGTWCLQWKSLLRQRMLRSMFLLLIIRSLITRWSRWPQILQQGHQVNSLHTLKTRRTKMQSPFGVGMDMMGHLCMLMLILDHLLVVKLIRTMRR